MKSRGSLVLMELLIMVLVFALAAAWCLQIFAGAARISEETARQDEAVRLAQNGAEVLKACGGNLEEAARIIGGMETSGDLLLEMERLETDIPGLGKALIRVMFEDETVFSLTVGWQEVDE